MEKQEKLILIAWITVMLILAFSDILKAKEYRLDTEFIFPSMKSNHVNNCNPDCANQDNGGIGIQIGIGGTLDISFVYIEMVNSLGNPGKVFAIEPAKADFRWKFIRGEISVWIMRVEGYKNDDGSDKEVNVVWPKFEVGINPFYWSDDFVKDIFLNYNYFNFIRVEITYLSIGYYHTF